MMHPYTEASKTGATLLARASDVNPRKLVLTLIEDHPSKTKEALFERFHEVVESDDDLRRAVAWYFFNNVFEQATKKKRNGCRDRSRIEAAADAIVRQIVMLDLLMPNGKPMKDCTGSEMAQFGVRFKRIAEQVGRTRRVGDVLDESNVRRIMKL